MLWEVLALRIITSSVVVIGFGCMDLSFTLATNQPRLLLFSGSEWTDRGSCHALIMLCCASAVVYCGGPRGVAGISPLLGVCVVNTAKVRGYMP
jgi:hypothetical protein